jgi:hypothetical protein
MLRNIRYREVSEDNEREEIYWFKRLRKFDYLIERSRFSSLSDDSNSASLIKTAANAGFLK